MKQMAASSGPSVPTCRPGDPPIKRREFIALLGSAVAWPLAPVKATDVGISFAETSDLSAFSGDHRGEAIRHQAAMRWTSLSLGSKMNSAHIRRVITAGMIGNVLEWYDFAIYGYFAAQIGRHFFPHDDAVAQLLSAFGIFAIGYLMRPIGGVLVGHIGDRFGRRAALIFSVTAMAIPTFLMGLLPGYQTIGVLAAI